MDKRRMRIGYGMSGLVVAFLLFDVIIHALNPSFVMDAMAGLGYGSEVAPMLAIVELVCLALYVYPKTAVLGAILLTGYLGGAVASNLRVGYSVFGNVLFPVYTGILLWGGLYLRDKKIADLIPIRKP
jgi:hypothetical protein